MARGEEEDYLALWRYVGWLLGVGVDDGGAYAGDGTDGVPRRRPLDPCGPGRAPAPDPIGHSRALLQSIIHHILDPDDSSAVVAHHLLRVGRDLPAPGAPASKWFYFRTLQCRRFVGDPLADALQLPLHPYLPTRVALHCASTLYLAAVRLYTLAMMFVTPFRRAMVGRTRGGMRRMHGEWRRTHQKKLRRALAAGTIVGIADVHGDAAAGKSTGGGECCPFAMTAPPTRDIFIAPSKSGGSKTTAKRFTSGRWTILFGKGKMC